jgi:hypothetical protein
MTEVYEDPHERARLRQLAIEACELCDEYGYDGSRVCDHVDRRETHRVGMAKVREALAGKRNDPRVLSRYADIPVAPLPDPQPDLERVWNDDQICGSTYAFGAGVDLDPEPELSGNRTLDDPEPEL